MHTAFIRVEVATFPTELGPLVEKREYNHTAAL